MINFTTFGEDHLAVLISLALTSALIIMAGKRGTPETKDIIAKGLAVTLIVQEMAMHVEAAITGLWTIQTYLPVHMCSLSIYLTGYALWTRRDMIFQTCYYWSIGAVHALATPNIESFFSPFRVVQFFTSHGLIVMGVLYLTFVYNMKATWHGLHLVMGITIAVTAFAGFVNWLIDANYMFLCEKPVGENILHMMPPWPWYIGILIIVVAAHFYLFYLPFRIAELRLKRNN